MNLPYLHRDRMDRRRKVGKQRLRRRFRHDRWLVWNMSPSTRAMLAGINTRRAKRVLGFESDGQVDEALWSAYERYDKIAVTKALLQRYVQPRKREARRRKLNRG
jgi:hypothetical protein